MGFTGLLVEVKGGLEVFVSIFDLSVLEELVYLEDASEDSEH